MSRVLLLLFILFSSLFAADEIEQFPFIGVTVSTHTIDIHSRDNFSNDEVIAGIRYGQQTLRWRTMFTYEFEQNGYKSFIVEIDRILKDDIYGITKIRPYAGVSLGTISYVNDNLAFDVNGTKKDETASKKEKNDKETNQDSESVSMDTSGYFYGLNLGLIVYVTDNIDMDIGYHYYDVQDFEGLNYIQGLTFSLHYFY
ncbi:MAG: hypothetical protein DSZ10_04090 [Sulfurovum sp.]|nr:MAG: hypothetical protein DSZ10_04090 [Sulfurovum sp.]